MAKACPTEVSCPCRRLIESHICLNSKPRMTSVTVSARVGNEIGDRRKCLTDRRMDVLY